MHIQRIIKLKNLIHKEIENLPTSYSTPPLPLYDDLGPNTFVPSKLVPAMKIDGKVVEEHLVEKPKAEWTKEDKDFFSKRCKGDKYPL